MIKIFCVTNKPLPKLEKSFLNLAGVGEHDFSSNYINTKSKIIVTGCPFCNTMMTDGVKNINEGAALVKDIAEVVAESLI